MSRPILAALAALTFAACDRGAPEPIAPPPADEAAPRAEPVVEAPPAQAPAAAAPAGDAPATAAVGQPAPDFTLTDQAGVEHRLADLRGKVVVLEWTNPGCPYVQRHYEAGTMTRLARKYAGEPVAWFSVDSSHFVTPASAEAWRGTHDVPYPTLLDPSGTVGRTYAARTTPHMFVIDAAGVLRYAGAIDDDVHGREDADTNHVEAAVDALLAGQDPPRATTEPYGCSVKYQS